MTDTTKLDLILEKMTRLDEKVSGLETDLKDVRQKVTKLDLIVENEIRVNIQRVAEGHLDLYRNIKDCINLSNEVKARQEMQDIYINIHDTKLKAAGLN